jgi:hypothetical protein
MTLPNELFLEVASHLKSFKDLNALVRTSRFFHGMFNTDLYRRAVAVDSTVRDDIVGWVLRRCRLASLTLLLDNGLSVNHTGRFFSRYFYEETMLFTLCRLVDQERSVPLARMLIQRGADIEKKNVYSDTVLLWAIWHDNYEITALLLAHGADLNVMDRWGKTPLHIASSQSDARMINLLVAHGATVD